MKHALVVGGTGMLSNVSLWLAGEGYYVSVVGRNPQKMRSLIESCADELRITNIIKYSWVLYLRKAVQDG